MLNVIYFRRVTTQKQYSHEISGILPKLTSNPTMHDTELMEHHKAFFAKDNIY